MSRTVEILIISITLAVVIIGAVMAALVGLVLPKIYFMEEESNETEKMGIAEMKEKERVKRDLNYVHTIQHPYLLSIHRPTYIDTDRSRKSASSCVGIAISENLAMAGRGCVGSAPEIFGSVVIRSESNHFTAGGVTHAVIKVFESPLRYPYSELCVLRVYPPFSSNVNPLYLPFRDMDYYNRNLEQLTLVEWDVRNERIHEEYWSLNRNICKDANDCNAAHKSPSQNVCCARASLDSCNWVKEHVVSLNGRPLVNAENYVMGMAFDYLKKPTNVFNRTTIFLALRHQLFLRWIYDVMYRLEFNRTVHYQPIELYSKVKIPSALLMEQENYEIF